jgi:ribosome-binding protein aMBF1 (putative translation factor)
MSKKGISIYPELLESVQEMDKIRKEESEHDLKVKRLYKRESLIYNLTEDILVALESKGMSVEQRSEKVDISKKVLNYFLHIGNTGKLSLDDFIDIMAELNLKIKVE